MAETLTPSTTAEFAALAVLALVVIGTMAWAAVRGCRGNDINVRDDMPTSSTHGGTTTAAALQGMTELSAPDEWLANPLFDTAGADE